MPASERFLSAYGQDEIAVHAQYGQSRSANRRLGDQDLMVPLKVVSPDVLSGVEQPDLGAAFGIDSGFAGGFS